MGISVTGGISIGPGGGGGLGALPFALRSTDSQPAIFTSIANRDAYYTANPGDIAGSTDLANQLEAVGIGPSDGDPSGVTAAFIRNNANDGWEAIASNFVGPPGADGRDGVAGGAMFSSIAERDSAYDTQEERDLLTNGELIAVNIDGDAVESQIWVGEDAPTSYDPNNWEPASLRTSGASVSFQDELRIFDYGEFIGFEDMVNNLTALAIGQRYSDAGGSEGARQLSFPPESTLLTLPEFGDSALQQVHEYTIDTTGLITNPAILLSATVNMLVAPEFYIVEIFEGSDDTGQLVYRNREEPKGQTGIHTGRPGSPQRILPDTTYFVRFTGDIPFQYRVAENTDGPGTIFTGFEFTFENLATETFANAVGAVDDSTFTDVDADSVQTLAGELDRLFGVVDAIQPGTGPGPSGRQLNIFTDSVTIDGANIDDFSNRNSIYARTDNARVTLLLPTEAVIDNNYPFVMEVQHFGGTSRISGGANPDNTIRVDTQGADDLQQPPGRAVTFSQLHQGDTAVITKTGNGEPFTVVESATDPRSSLLPAGAFILQEATVSLNPVLGFISGFPSLLAITQGQAFEVRVGGDGLGFEVSAGDVIVAKQDTPSRALDGANDDWLVIRDTQNFPLSLAEIRFLTQVTEVDTFSDSRLVDRSDVTNVRVWLSPFILDHAPFINPSTDGDNPQSGETEEYEGGDEDVGTGNEFEFGSNLPSRLVYIDIDGSFTANEILPDTYLVHRGRDGGEIARFNLDTEFRGVVLSGSSDTYYVFDDVAAADNFSSINYLNGETLEVVIRATNRAFNISSAVNVLSAIADGTIDISKLDPTTQALILADHSLSVEDQAKLEGLQTDVSSTAIPNNENIYVKLNEASSVNDLSHYVPIEQQNGIIPDYERTSVIHFLVRPQISVTGLQKTENTATKLSVTRAGTVSTGVGTAAQTWQLFTATLPAITGANSVLDNTWQLDGTLDSSFLNGAVNTFKVHTANLDSEILDRLNQHTPATAIPPPLPALAAHLVEIVSVTNEWAAKGQSPIRSQLTRLAAVLWDENRRTFTNGNYFEDITPDIEFIGFQPNNVFYYNTPSDPLNSSFPGAQSYILESTVRIRNESPNTTPIPDDWNLIIGFDYALERQLDTGEEVSVFRIGTSGGAVEEPLMLVTEASGLVLRIGREDGGARSRTYTLPLFVADHQWGTVVDQTEIGEAEIIIPDGLTGALTVTVNVQLDNNGNDEGTHVETIAITNVGSDQSFGDRTFFFTGFPGVTVTFDYEATNNDEPFSRRVLFARPTAAFGNAALTYIVSATYEVTESWTAPNTYANFPIAAGNNHDDFGLYDPHLDSTETVFERNRVLFVLRTYREDDQEADPEMAVTVIVDGRLENNGQPIRLHRPFSDFNVPEGFQFSSTETGVSHIQIYNYEKALIPTGRELTTLYNGVNVRPGLGNLGLGAFDPPGLSVETFQLDANLELTDDHGLRITNAENETYEYRPDADGVLTPTLIS